MTNDVVPFDINKATEEEIRRLTGQSQQAPSQLIPRLNINRDADDDDGNTLPVGHYVVFTPDHGNVYGRPAIFRPLLNRFQYSIWNNETKKTTARSKVFTYFDEEVYDTAGGFKCGKLTRKQSQGLTDAQKEVQKGIKLHRNFYGLVTFDGITAKGAKVAIKNMPVNFRTGGSAFMDIDEVIKSIDKQKHPLFCYNIALTAKREKSGSNTYYVPVLNVDFQTFLKPDDQVKETIMVIIGELQKENEGIYKAWTEARKSVTETKFERELVEADYSELAADFNDSVDDVGR